MREIVASEELSRNLRRRGALILALGGLIWVSVGTSGTTGSPIGRVVTAAVAVAVTLAAIALAVRSGSRPAGPRRLPADWLHRVGVVNLVQLGVIAVAVVALIAAGRTNLLPPVISLVVGLHFLPLARLFGQWQYRWTGVLQSLTAIAGIVSYLAGSGSTLASSIAGIGTAVILWGTSIHVSITSLSTRPAPTSQVGGEGPPAQASTQEAGPQLCDCHRNS